MTKQEEQAVEVCREFDRLKGERNAYEQPWQDIRELVRPNAQDFYRQASKGDTRTENIYDGTAVQALEELASALHSYMVSPVERWFALDIDGDESLNRDEEVNEWLEQVSDTIYAQYSDDRTGFASSVFEGFLDIGAFGNANLNQEWNDDEDCLVFRAIPLAVTFFEEDQYGRIDKVFRCMPRTKRQLIQQFGEEALPKEVMEEKNAREWELIHKVCPRGEREYGKEDAINKRYVSCWVLRKPSLILKESGYDSMPYHVARWSKVSGETYGRGPAIKCLPDIKMLNRMERTIIRAVQKATDPVLDLPSDGYLLPIKTAPGSINFREPGTEPMTALEHRGNFPVSFEFSEQKRTFIRNCFYADWVKLMPKKERQTAYEVSELVEQQLRMMAPMLGRIQTELLGPMITRSVDLLSSRKRFPLAPDVLRQRNLSLKIGYVSPAARAQVGSKAMQMGKFIQELMPLAQVDPTVMDSINFARYASELALLRGITRRIIRSDDEVAAIRQAREQQQQAAQLLENAEPATRAVKNLSEANAAGNIF